ncbi:MAG: 50S ribosomal protein L6 [Gammaproteobacteria bacterium]|nr:MAG: 50S ribosomal protein L6 [Gammaproteobacteria bacterium]
MSRIAKKPIKIPQDVEVSIKDNNVSFVGKSGKMSLELHPAIKASLDDGILTVKTLKDDKETNALSGTMRALLNNCLVGSSIGFEKKLQLVGVGYRAQIKGNILGLSLGFSHPVNHAIPDGITVETPSNTEILIKGCDKQQVGQVAADIRSYRPPEPYKGKGIKYSDEHIIRKEAKKK